LSAGAYFYFERFAKRNIGDEKPVGIEVEKDER